METNIYLLKHLKKNRINKFTIEQTKQPNQTCGWMTEKAFGFTWLI
jgi:hypothetical protein